MPPDPIKPDATARCFCCKNEFPLDELETDPRGENAPNRNSLYCDVCKSEIFDKCDDCLEWGLLDDMRSGPGDTGLCQDCYDHNYFCCDGCTEIYHNDHYATDGQCEDCYEEEEEESEMPGSAINSHGYDARRALRMLGSPEDGLHFGIELEVEVQSGKRSVSSLSVQESLEGFAILKDDSSLKNGFEIVTAPAEYRLHYKKWQPFFDKVKEYKSDYGMKSFDTTTCGMHIHFSRNAATEIQLAKIMCFLHNPVNKNFVETIAGRPANSYCKYTPKTFATAERETRSVSGDRYQALNITNKSTAEVRIFKGTLKQSSFFKNLEFVHALIHFTKPGSRTLDNSISYTKFLEWLKKYPATTTDYPNLLNFLLEKKIIAKKENQKCVSLSKKSKTIPLRKRTCAAA